MVAITFRLLSVILGPILALIIHNIYIKTRGGSKGWLYMTLAFISLGVWSLSQLVFLVLFDSYIGRTLTGTVFFMLMSFLNPLAAVRLSRDMKCRLPPWLTERNVIITGCAYYMIVFSYIMLGSGNPLAPLSSASIMGMVVMFSLAAVGYVILARRTGIRVWFMWTAATIVVIFGAFFVASYANCCGELAPLAETPTCADYMYDYGPLLIPCMEWMLPLSSNGASILSVGILIYLIAGEKLRRLMSG